MQIPEPPRVALGRIVSDLGSTLVEVVAGVADPDVGVCGVLIHDPLDEPSRLPGAIVLGVGVYGPEPVAALVEHAHGLGAAAVMVRSPVAADGPVVKAAADTGLVVLGLTSGASWAQVAALLRSLIATDAAGADPAPGPATPLGGDLFALANAIAGLLDGPVTIEDRGGAVLAFSARQDEADDSRIATILDRQVPAEKLRALEKQGAFRALYRSDDPIYIAGIGEKPRVAIAIRAGGEILGSIWVVVPGPLNDDRAQAFREAAGVAALHLLRQRSGADADRRLRADLLATVLEGGAQAMRAAARLGLTAQRACVLAVAVDAETADDTTDPGRAAAGDRIAGSLALHLSAVHPHTAVASLGSVTYAVLPCGADDDARRVAAAFLARLGVKVPTFIGIGRLADRPTDLRRSRSDADRALRVLRSRAARACDTAEAPPAESVSAESVPAQRIACLSDVYVASLLDELADRMAAEDDRPDGPVVRLRAYDREHGAQFTETLAAWLDTFGDVAAAAARVHVHPNTFRYRLRRLSEVAGIDLADAEARFEAMVQLRLRVPEAD
ncbi:PucR family transcriptional regulator [Catenulispora pinisilvae]|uniref:PucR family transcriptional regulator n=1 Tax=Catenulispora pinisilvae TaxID=2705253 RepID=UPI002B26AC34|nr:helix-turn-helix domain-containing protein [Catenulispora pinisilvae]